MSMYMYTHVEMDAMLLDGKGGKERREKREKRRYK